MPVLWLSIVNQSQETPASQKHAVWSPKIPPWILFGREIHVSKIFMESMFYNSRRWAPTTYNPVPWILWEMMSPAKVPSNHVITTHTPTHPFTALTFGPMDSPWEHIFLVGLPITDSWDWYICLLFYHEKSTIHVCKYTRAPRIRHGLKSLWGLRAGAFSGVLVVSMVPWIANEKWRGTSVVTFWVAKG